MHNALPMEICCSLHGTCESPQTYILRPPLIISWIYQQRREKEKGLQKTNTKYIRLNASLKPASSMGKRDLAHAHTDRDVRSSSLHGDSRANSFDVRMPRHIEYRETSRGLRSAIAWCSTAPHCGVPSPHRLRLPGNRTTRKPSFLPYLRSSWARGPKSKDVYTGNGIDQRS